MRCVRSSIARAQGRKPGRRENHSRCPPSAGRASTRCTIPKPRRPSTVAHSRGRPGRRPRPAPRARRRRPRRNRSGCQPRRRSSPAVGFCTQPIEPTKPRWAHWLQPMHSAMSRNRPLLIFSGRNGSAMPGRAPATMSTTPLRTRSAIRSAEVRRPFAATGFAVCALTLPVHSSAYPSGYARDGVRSTRELSSAPTTRSQRSTRWSAARMKPSASSRSTPAGTSASTAIRATTAQSSPMASRTRSMVSSHIRARFANVPP